MIFLTTGSDIIPSLRISALGPEFAFLIEDPFTDIQYNPALLGNQTKTSIYLRPEWPISGTYYGNRIIVGFFAPGTIKNLGSGILASHSIYSYTSINEDNGQNDIEIDSAKSMSSSPSAMFFLAIPFLKKNGFLGLKLSYQKSEIENSLREYYFLNDTSYYNSDTTKLNRNRNDFSGYYTQPSNLILRISQCLPFENSSLNFVIGVNYGNEKRKDYDSTTNNDESVYIQHLGLIRQINKYTSVSEMFRTNTEDKKIWSSILGINWTKYAGSDYLRLMFEIDAGKGSRETKDNGLSREFVEHYFEYTDPDTSYSFTDTLTNNYTTIDEGDKLNINNISGEAGICHKKSITNNFSIFLGLKGIITEEKETIPDSFEKDNKTYKITTPFGSEIFLSSQFCLRGGVAPVYKKTVNESNDLINYDSYKNMNETISIINSIGIGTNVGSRLILNLSFEGENLTQVDYWKIESLYNI